MEQEDKELLIKEISTRLPYGVKLYTRFKDIEVPLTIFSINTKGWVSFKKTDGHLDYLNVTDCRLYLRPMSSMTDEEKYKLYGVNGVLEIDFEFEPYKMVHLLKSHNVIDWLNKHHFDYRGLIEKGLAIEASEGMYN